MPCVLRQEKEEIFSSKGKFYFPTFADEALKKSFILLIWVSGADASVGVHLNGEGGGDKKNSRASKHFFRESQILYSEQIPHLPLKNAFSSERREYEGITPVHVHRGEEGVPLKISKKLTFYLIMAAKWPGFFSFLPLPPWRKSRAHVWYHSFSRVSILPYTLDFSG